MRSASRYLYINRQLLISWASCKWKEFAINSSFTASPVGGAAIWCEVTWPWQDPWTSTLTSTKQEAPPRTECRPQHRPQRPLGHGTLSTTPSDHYFFHFSAASLWHLWPHQKCQFYFVAWFLKLEFCVHWKSARLKAMYNIFYVVQRSHFVLFETFNSSTVQDIVNVVCDKWQSIVEGQSGVII